MNIRVINLFQHSIFIPGFKMQTSSVPLDESDCCPDLDFQNQDNIELASSHIWKGGYNRRPNLPPVYLYPFAEWIPNSICYADFRVRSRSFDKWPKQLRPTKSELQKSGFFYRGFGDSVECFFCGICLHDWESRDNANKEHKKWSLECKFINMIAS